MELEETINNLQEYIDLDRKMRTSPIEEWSDFDKFCELHCRHIEKALHYIKEESIPRAVLKEKKNELDNEIKEYNEWRKRGQETDVEYYTNIGNEVARDILQEILTKGEK